MFKMTRTDPEWKDKIITGDETWVYGYDPETKRQSAEWRGQDIAPNDFFLFPKLKAVLKGRHFDTREDIIEKSLLALKSIPKEAYKNCFDNWEKRWRCYSKWPEVIIMNSTTAGNTIRVLRDLFSRYGIPDQVVTDNGPQFVSEEMKYFFKSNGVHHLRSAPYFPATNGLAERFVQTLKRGLKNMRNEELNKSLANFLFTYRTVPHSSTREAPAVLFLKRMLKCKWNLLKPKLEVKPGFKKGYSPDFEEDENILVRDFLGPNKWKEGKVIKRLGKCFYTVKLNDGRLWRRHVCQLRKNYIVPSPAPEIFLPEQLIKCPSNESRAEDGSVEIPSKENIPSSPGIPAPEEPGPAASDQDRTPQRRYPMRDRRPPERFGF
ncbi:K02A2.6-like [Cordylochernes scorpioides]|uniref:K02A2.6-like n=1 Tax=Cordylochernes scorpioides TaxID=51811 RepID=A0ABY6JW34_9ARAC|nr:K02A2.6-like [Cordylochernes scorpioides]